MHIHLTLNGEQTTWDTAPHELLLTALRRAGMWSVKHGLARRATAAPAPCSSMAN